MLGLWKRGQCACAMLWIYDSQQENILRSVCSYFKVHENWFKKKKREKGKKTKTKKKDVKSVTVKKEKKRKN